MDNPDKTIEYYFEKDLDYKRLKKLEKDFEELTDGVKLEDVVDLIRDGWVFSVTSPRPETPFLQ